MKNLLLTTYPSSCSSSTLPSQILSLASPALQEFIMSEDTRKATVESHLHSHTPPIDEIPGQWDWPFWKFGYGHNEALFKELHAKYNSIPCAIQDPFAWHLDVCGVADIANTREEFETLLKKRRDERFDELTKAWHDIAIMLISESYRFTALQDETDCWVRLIRISRHFSYDSIIGFFSPYCKELKQLPPMPPDWMLTDKSREMLLKDREARKKAMEAEPQPCARCSSPGASTQHGLSGLRMENEKRPERDYRKPQMVDEATQTTMTLMREGIAAERIPPPQAAENPNKGVKRRRTQNKPAASNPQGVRRSARLQEQAERQAKRRKL